MARRTRLGCARLTRDTRWLLVHFSDIDSEGYRSLSGVSAVLLEYERVEQDGYRFRAVRVVLAGRAKARPSDEETNGAYESNLRIEWDER